MKNNPPDRNWASGDLCLHYRNGMISHVWLLLKIEVEDDLLLFLDLRDNSKFKAIRFNWDFSSWEFFPITTDQVVYEIP